MSEDSDAPAEWHEWAADIHLTAVALVEAMDRRQTPDDDLDHEAVDSLLNDVDTASLSQALARFLWSEIDEHGDVTEWVEDMRKLILDKRYGMP